MYMYIQIQPPVYFVNEYTVNNDLTQVVSGVDPCTVMRLEQIQVQVVASNPGFLLRILQSCETKFETESLGLGLYR